MLYRYILFVKVVLNTSFPFVVVVFYITFAL